MQEEGFELSFIHKSVAQYYAALFVARSSDDFGSQFYQLASQNQSWDLELRFLSQIDAYRYSRYFEIPLLDILAADIGIDLDSPRHTDAKSVSAFFTARMNLVAFARELRPDVSSEIRPIFAGWASDLVQADQIRREVSALWIGPVMSIIEVSIGVREQPFVVSESLEFIPLSRFEHEAAGISNEISEVVLRNLRERRKKASEVVNAEKKKTALISVLLNKVGHSQKMNSQ